MGGGHQPADRASADDVLPRACVARWRHGRGLSAVGGIACLGRGASAGPVAWARAASPAGSAGPQLLVDLGPGPGRSWSGALGEAPSPASLPRASDRSRLSQPAGRGKATCSGSKPPPPSNPAAARAAARATSHLSTSKIQVMTAASLAFSAGGGGKSAGSGVIGSCKGEWILNLAPQIPIARNFCRIPY
jgi:hypothetical protein